MMDLQMPKVEYLSHSESRALAKDILAAFDEFIENELCEDNFELGTSAAYTAAEEAEDNEHYLPLLKKIILEQKKRVIKYHDPMVMRKAVLFVLKVVKDFKLDLYAYGAHGKKRYDQQILPELAAFRAFLAEYFASSEYQEKSQALYSAKYAQELQNIMLYKVLLATRTQITQQELFSQFPDKLLLYVAKATKVLASLGLVEKARLGGKVCFLPQAVAEDESDLMNILTEYINSHRA